MNPDGVNQLIGNHDDYSIAWLSRRIMQLNREILERAAERDKWQAMLDRKFAKHKAQENRK
jgi:hypothetical protein